MRPNCCKQEALLVKRLAFRHIERTEKLLSRKENKEHVFNDGTALFNNIVVYDILRYALRWLDQAYLLSNFVFISVEFVSLSMFAHSFSLWISLHALLSSPDLPVCLSLRGLGPRKGWLT